MTQPRLRRKHALRFVRGLVAGVVGVAMALSVSPPVEAARPSAAQSYVSAPRGATPVRATPDHPACGPGMTALELVRGDRRLSCIHTASDPAPTHPPNQSAVRTHPVCHGDGVNGPRIEFIYVYVEGQPNRAAELFPHMLNSWIPAMEGTFRSTSKRQGRELGMRVHMPKCKIEIGVVRMDADEGQLDEPGPMYMRIAKAISEAGYERPHRKYHVWFDGGTYRACGVANADLGPVTGDNPTQANANNIGAVPKVGPWEVAITWKYRAPSRPGERRLDCWGIGRMGALVETHELLHLLGSVLRNSPYSDGRSHCIDQSDIMCYGRSMVPRCVAPVELLDCGSDDYFAIDPPRNSFLATHWNTANSRFLGEALEDDVPVYPPRP